MEAHGPSPRDASANAITYGSFLGSLVDFLIVAFVVFDGHEGPAEFPRRRRPRPGECPRCKEIIPGSGSECRASASAV